LTGRLRFSFGQLCPDPGSDYYLCETLLKILDSPKPPYPSFYFKNNRGKPDFISKEDLSPDKHVPQGRKFYLHQRDSASPPPWETHHAEPPLSQKSRVTPMKKGLSFYFHIDFCNLSKQELGLLCYAIRPSDGFRHKLGMGKPIGLGTVRIDPVGLFYIDRERRYRQDTAIFEAPRYHGAWLREGEQPRLWPGDYAFEQRESGIGLNGFPLFSDLRDHARQKSDPDICQAIELLGDPGKVRKPVHTPQTAQVIDLELETFKWFMNNQRQFLQPVDRTTKPLQQLER